MAQADVALQSALRETAPQELATKVLEIKTLQKSTAADSSKFLQLIAEHIKLTGNVRRLRSKDATVDTVFEGLKSGMDECECPENCTKVSRRREKCSGTPSMAAYNTVFSDRDELKNRCKTLTL